MGLYQHDAIYEKDTWLQLITHGSRKSNGILFYDERNFVAIIGSKSRWATRDSRETEC